MSTISPINSAAIQLLQQSRIDSNTATENDLVSAVNGTEDASKTEDAKNTDDYWGVFQVNSTQLKAELFQKLMEAFALDQEESSSPSSMSEAIQAQIDELKKTPEGLELLAKIEKNLGLDELGISLDTFLEAAFDPESEANDELDLALAKYLSEDERLEEIGSVLVDENGIYSIIR